MLPLKLMRDIIEKIYEAPTRYDCSMRDMAKMMHTKYALSAKYLLAQAQKLQEVSPNLINDEHHLTLRAAKKRWSRTTSPLQPQRRALDCAVGGALGRRCCGRRSHTWSRPARCAAR